MSISRRTTQKNSIRDRLVRESRQDHAASRPHEADLAQRQLDGLGGPGRLDDEVDAVPAGEAPRRVRDRLPRPGDGRVRAQVPSQTRAAGPCARRPGPGSRAPAGAGGRAARASRPRRRPRSPPAAAPPGPPLAPRPRAARRRGARPRPVPPAPASMPAPAGPPARRSRRPGRCPTAVRARQRFPLPSRQRSHVAASPVRLDGDAVPGRDAGDARPDRHDVADELVSGDQRVPDAPLARPDPVVGAADPRRLDADERLARAGAGSRHRLDPEGARSREHGGLHRRPHPALRPPSMKTTSPVT